MKFKAPYKAVLLALVLPAAISHGATQYDYLDDSNIQVGRAGSNEGFPKIMLTELRSWKGTDEQFSKYDVIGHRASGMRKLAKIQQIDPNVQFHYFISPRAYLGYLQKVPCEQGMGIPFNHTGPASKDCTMFAGHWLYMAGTSLEKAVNGSSTTIYVNDANKLTVGNFVVIYDPPDGSFKNAEHAKVVAIDKRTTPHKVTLNSRGFKSNAVSHPKGAIVAEHDTGNGGSSENWGYNMSQRCPVDAQGRTMAKYMTDWIVANQKRDAKGNLYSNVWLDGVYFDVDNYFINRNRWDVDNDLVPDAGMTPGGHNLWGEGLLDFYDLMRASFPSKRIVGGARRSRGFEDLNGIQVEGWPVAGGYHSPNPSYEGPDGFDALFQRYTVHMRHHQAGEPYTENLAKTPTKLYPDGHTGLKSNAPFRFAFGSTLLDDGYFGQQNSVRHPAPWFDEYAVDVTPGSSRYGRAIASNPSDESQIRAHKGWLGRPLSPRVRLYDPSRFAAKNSLIGNGDFEAGTTGWSGKNVTVSRVTNSASRGAASLRVSRHLKYDSNIASTYIVGPSFNVVKGRQYTLSFAAKASSMRDLTIAAANAKGNFLVPDQWTRIIRTFTANKTGSYKLRFNLGREDTLFWLDDVYLFEGNANVFWRDYENGVVVVNATPSQETVDLGGPFLRIKGTGQDAVNNGARITSVTLPPYDAAILVRPDGTQQSSGGGGTGGGGSKASLGQPQYVPAQQAATLLWEDANTGVWHLRATAGSSQTALVFKGTLTKGQITSVKRIKLEQSDILRRKTDGTVSYQFTVIGDGQDGFDFTVKAGTNPCLDNRQSSKTKLLIGKNMTAAVKPLNLVTLKTCTP